VEIRSFHFLFSDPPNVSETNRARKLKFGTPVGAYAFTRTSVRYENLSARGRLGKSGAPTFYFETPLISPKLIELESLNLVCWQGFSGTMATYEIIKQQKLMLKTSMEV